MAKQAQTTCSISLCYLLLVVRPHTHAHRDVGSAMPIALPLNLTPFCKKIRTSPSTKPPCLSSILETAQHKPQGQLDQSYYALYRKLQGERASEFNQAVFLPCFHFTEESMIIPGGKRVSKLPPLRYKCSPTGSARIPPLLSTSLLDFLIVYAWSLHRLSQCSCSSRLLYLPRLSCAPL